MIEEGTGDTVNQIINRVNKQKINLLLPLDVVVAERAAKDAMSQVTDANSIPGDMMIVDIGPKTISSFKRELERCKTVFWNGPMGVYEVPSFAKGTRGIAEAIAGLKAITAIGGGSTADAVAEFGLVEKMTFVSTGGGASLSFLSGEKLPGIEVLPDKR